MCLNCMHFDHNSWVLFCDNQKTQIWFFLSLVFAHFVFEENSIKNIVLAFPHAVSFIRLSFSRFNQILFYMGIYMATLYLSCAG